MKPQPLYCEMCPGDGAMCYRCTEDYLEQCRQYREAAATSTPANAPNVWFWILLGVGAVLAAGLVVYSCLPLVK